MTKISVDLIQQLRLAFLSRDVKYDQHVFKFTAT